MFVHEGLLGKSIMTICEFNELYCVCVCVWDGSKGVGVWFGAPSILRISSLNLAWHWQIVCGHVHFMSHYRTVCYWFMLLKFPAFVSV